MDRQYNLYRYIETFKNTIQEKTCCKELEMQDNTEIYNLELAKKIQKSILPKSTEFKNVKFQYGYLPTSDLSADIFDVIKVNEDKIAFYMADVVGHGVEASIITLFIAQTVRDIINKNPMISPSKLLLELKDGFKKLGLGEEKYFTIIFMMLDIKKKELIYSNAGHNCMPILFNEKSVAFMVNKGMIISNIFVDVSYNEKTLKVESGDQILLYTDGLMETVDKLNRMFGENRLKKWILKNRKEKEIINKLIKFIEMYRFGKQKDDVAMLHLKIGGENEN